MSLSSSAKRKVINIILLIMVVVLAWLVYSQLQKDQAGAETLYHESIGDSVQRLEIALPGKETLMIESGGNESDVWNITQPVMGIASKQALQQLFTLLGEPVLAEYSAMGKDLDDFGLAASSIRVRFNSVEYRLGKLNPVNHQRYILLNDKILMVNEAVYELVQLGVDGFKGKD